MKRLAGYVILSLVVLATWTPSSSAQDFAGPAGKSGPAFDSMFQSPLGGLVWLGATGADRGLGYDGSYLTAGGKQPIGDDFLRGEWFLEGQAHVSAERGKFFSNLGLERVFHIKPANSDLGMNVWVDYDADEYETFGHTYWQVGVGGFLKAPWFDFYVNGYLPQGDQDHLANTNPFVGNQIVVPSMDSALEGFDARWRVPIPRFANVQAYVELGGYYYNSELVDGFGGFTTSVGCNPFPGVAVNLQLNNDEQFNTTGYAQVILMAGGNGAPQSTPRALERSVRNDHVVRVNRPEFVAINPLTGTPWRVVHVDSDAAFDAAVGTGTFEDPYSLLSMADPTQFAPSIAQQGDIILVRQGANDFVNHDTGITLQDNQWLLGEGVAQSIPLDGYGMYELPLVQNGLRPSINNQDNNTAATVQLANGNVVRGLNVTSNSTEAAIRGDAIVSGLISNNVIFGSQGNAIFIDGLTGMLSINDNVIDNQVIDPLVPFDTVSINNVTNAFLEIDGNTIGSANSLTGIGDGLGGDAIHMEGVTFSDIVISDNLIFSPDLALDPFINGDGVELTVATDTNLLVINNSIANAAQAGINVNASERINAAIRGNSLVVNQLAGVLWAEATGTLVVDSIQDGLTQNISQNGSGVLIRLGAAPTAGAPDSSVLNFYAYSNTFAQNGTAINMFINGEAATTQGPTFNFDVRNNLMVSNGFGVTWFQDSGAKVTGNISENQLFNQALNVGFTQNSVLTAGVSTLDLRIANNNMANSGLTNAGNLLTDPLDPFDDFDDGTNGIYGEITGTSIANVDIRDNVIEGAGIEGTPAEFGDSAIQFFFNVTPFTTPDSPYEPPVSTITMVRNQFFDSFNHARTFNLYGDSQVQLTSLYNRTFKTVGLDGAPINDTGEDVGFNLQTHDRSVAGLFMDGDVFTDNQFNGIYLLSQDQSRIFSTIRNTQILNFGRADEETPIIDQFYNTGVEVFAQDQSIQVFDFQNNTIDATLPDLEEVRLSMRIHNEAGSQGQIYATVNNNIFASELLDEDGDLVETPPLGVDFYMYQQGAPGIVPNAGTLSLSLNGNLADFGYLIENRNDPLNIPPFYFTGNGNQNFDPVFSFNPPNLFGNPSTVRVGQSAPVNLAPLTDFIRKP